MEISAPTGGNRDGRVGRWRIHLLHQTQQKYLQMWNNSHQKITKLAERPLYNQGGERDPHVMRQQGKRNDHLYPREQTQRRREISQAEILPGEWAVRATYEAPQSWGPPQRRQASWLVGVLVGLTGRLGKAFCSQRSAHMLVHSWNRAKSADQNCVSSWLAFHNCPMNKLNVPAPLTSCCNSTLERGLTWPRKEPSHET